jgi:hypothetical protein
MMPGSGFRPCCQMVASTVKMLIAAPMPVPQLMMLPQ